MNKYDEECWSNQTGEAKSPSSKTPNVTPWAMLNAYGITVEYCVHKYTTGMLSLDSGLLILH